MMSSSATEIRHGNRMHTFKIQGKLYHAVGSLLWSTNKEPTFVQIYFMGNEELDRRLTYVITPMGKFYIITTF